MKTSAVFKLNNNDRSEVDSFLAHHADSSMFIRSNLARAGLEYEDRDYSGDYWGVYDGRNITGILAHYWNGNVMMQCPAIHDLVQLASVFIEERTRKIKGILGLEEQAGIVVDLLAISPERFAINNTEGLFALDLKDLVMPDTNGFSLMSPLEMDQDALFHWIRDYDMEALGFEDGPSLYEHINQRIERMEEATIVALVHNNAPVSLAGCNARVGNVNQIGPVWTPPEFRGRGYARRATAMLLDQERHTGISRSILFTDNPAAVAAYYAIGYRRIGSYRLALLK